MRPTNVQNDARLSQGRQAWHICCAVLAFSLTGISVCSAATVVDDLGRTINLPDHIQRIISLTPSVTEILYAVGAQSKLVADTAYCDYPSQAKTLPHVGDTVNPNAEIILALRPEVVVISDPSTTVDAADMMEKRWHTKVLVTNPVTYIEVEKNIKMLGALFGSSHETRLVVARMESARTAVEKTVGHGSRPSVFVVVWDNPLMTATNNTFIGDMLTIAGGKNITGGMPGTYPTCSPELLVQRNPDYVLTSLYYS